MKNLVLHFDLGYSYQNNVSVRSRDLRAPAGDDLAHRRRLRRLDASIGIPVGVHLRAQAALARSTATAMGGALLGDLGAGLLARPDRPLPLRVRTSASSTLLPRRRELRAAHAATPRSWFLSLILPWFVLAAAFAAFYARMVRGNLIEVMGEDYIRTARAKGLSERRVILRHGLRAALTPVVTLAGLDIGHPPRRRRPHRDGLQHPGRRALRLRLDRQLGPAGDPGHRALRRRLHHRREPRRRHPVRVPRPAGALLSGALLEIDDLRVSLPDAGRRRPRRRRRLARGRPRAARSASSASPGSGKSVTRAHGHGPDAAPERDRRGPRPPRRRRLARAAGRRAPPRSAGSGSR